MISTGSIKKTWLRRDKKFFRGHIANSTYTWQKSSVIFLQPDIVQIWTFTQEVKRIRNAEKVKILKAELSEKDLCIRQDAENFEVGLTSQNRINFLKPCGLGDRSTVLRTRKSGKEEQANFSGYLIDSPGLTLLSCKASGSVFPLHKTRCFPLSRTPVHLLYFNYISTQRALS